MEQHVVTGSNVASTRTYRYQQISKNPQDTSPQQACTAMQLCGRACACASQGPDSLLAKECTDGLELWRSLGR
eukprot:scaffold1883_cov108-Isochrysis_galbana.AAC.9